MSAGEEPDDLIQLQPEKPLKLGINGFDRIGRLAFRAALESGLEVGAINDPFIPLHYMVYSLKFDMAHSKTRKKDMSVTESPSGHLVVNDKQVTAQRLKEEYNPMLIDKLKEKRLAPITYPQVME